MGQGNIFTPVSDSVHRGGGRGLEVCVSPHAMGVYTPWADIPSGNPPREDTPPPDTSTEAGGTPPTGIHSSHGTIFEIVAALPSKWLIFGIWVKPGV